MTRLDSMENKISVKQDINSNQENGYIVTITNGLTGEIRKHTVNTDPHGDGLWIDGKQIEGTCQFMFVNSNSYRRYFAETA